MKITIDRSTLLEALNQLVKVVPSKPTIPILDGVLIESNGVLTLTAGDVRNEISTSTDDYLEHAPGSAVIPARKLLEVIKKLPDGPVKIDVEGGRARINPKKVDLPTLDAEEFPRKDKPQGQPFEMDGKTFSELVKSTAYAVSTNESHPILAGICLQISDGQITAIATDRHRLARVTIATDANATGSYVIPAKVLLDIAKAIPKKVSIWLDGSVHIKAGDFHYSLSQLDGTYPDVSRVVPTGANLTFAIEREQLLGTLELAETVNEDKTKVVRLAIGESSIDLSVKNDGSSMEDSIPAEVEGEGFAISANAKYLADALKAMDSEKVMFKLSGKMNPVIIEPVGKDGVLHLVLPYRTGV